MFYLGNYLLITNDMIISVAQRQKLQDSIQVTCSNRRCFIPFQCPRTVSTNLYTGHTCKL